MQRGRWADWAWFLAWAVGSSAWCLGAARELGATFDEPVYVACGLTGWRTGSRAPLMKLGTMPLPIDVTTLPLYLWERYHGVTIDPEADLARVLPWARAGTLLFWWLLLGYGWRAGAQLGGRWGARLAVALLASEPSLLAHASLATTDIAASACLLALVYHFVTGRSAGWRRRVALPAFWFAATVLAKASGLVFGPICLAAVEMERLVRGGAFSHQPGRRWPPWFRQVWQEMRPLRHDGRWIIGLGTVLVFVYCGCDWKTQPSFVKWAHGLPPGPTATVMAWLADHVRIFSNAGEGLVRQVTHNIRGHDVYVLGRTIPRAVWYYFPVALTIKLSVPLLLLAGGLALARPWSLRNWACAAAGALLLFSITYRVQIGIRLVLPLVVLAIVGLAGAATAVWQRESSSGRRRMFTAGLAAGVVWTALAAIAVWPHALCYTNELWGGTRRGYLRLSDSNYDWGQGLPELVRWKERHGIEPLDIWYMGTDPALRTLPIRPLWLHALPLQTADDVAAAVRGRCVAVSTTLLYGAYWKTMAHEVAGCYFRARRPAGRTLTYFIYDFRAPGK